MPTPHVIASSRSETLTTKPVTANGRALAENDLDVRSTVAGIESKKVARMPERLSRFWPILIAAQTSVRVFGSRRAAVPPSMRLLIVVAFAVLVSCGGSRTTTSMDVGSTDRDGDRVSDSEDRCPCIAEDPDGFEDVDGCRDEDNDRDRIVDACDVCPNDPETYDGCADEDGCPDGEPGAAVVDAYLHVVPPVFFERGTSSISPESLRALEDMARTLLDFPQIARAQVEGHADRGEPDAERLALARAETVRDWLVAHGVAASRLEVMSHGVSNPRAPRSASHARSSENSRVELRFLSVDEGEASRTPERCRQARDSNCSTAPPRVWCVEGPDG
jgi:outer membrane protein OmpA-like peptidoglycan-associated protein